MLIKAGDTVVVTAGADKGVRAKVIKIDRLTGKMLVEGVNRVYKHVKRSQKNPQGGRLNKEMPIDASNVQFFCDSCSRGVRLGARFLEDGAKERLCKKCGGAAGTIAPPHQGHAKH